MTPTAASPFGDDAVGRLVVCPTPIGNLEDVTLRVLATLRRADVVACEDTRHTRVLLDRHGIGAGGLVSLHEHNERARVGELLGRVREGALVALVSDAGMPLVSDPGYVLVHECIAAGLALEVLPGPSAVLTALVASGLPAERWRFVGFLPRSGGELRELLRGVDETLVAFESPRRLARTLAELAALDGDRAVAVCRELTKLHEEVRRGTAAQLAERYRAQGVRGEVVLVVGAAHAQAAQARELGEAVAAVEELVGAGAKPRAAAAVVARLTGLRANELYRSRTSLDTR
jgi:16S rRNA (cytidine1402-2'-O)-methyltransferase